MPTNDYDRVAVYAYYEAQKGYVVSNPNYSNWTNVRPSINLVGHYGACGPRGANRPLAHGYGQTSSIRPIVYGSNATGPVHGESAARGLPQIPKYSESSSDNGIDSSLLCGFSDMGQRSDSVEHYVPSAVPHVKSPGWYPDSGTTNHVCHDASALNETTCYTGNVPLFMGDGT